MNYRTPAFQNHLPPYIRQEVDGLPVYFYPEVPDWFVPTAMADQLLCTDENDGATEWLHPKKRTFLERIRPPEIPVYEGRKHAHSLTHLRECWFHVTDRCDMACSHCMFRLGGGNSGTCSELCPEHLRTAISEAKVLGCRIFYFTGGEPLIYPGITDVFDHVLSSDGTHVVVLTNANNVKRHA